MRVNRIELLMSAVIRLGVPIIIVAKNGRLKKRLIQAFWRISLDSVSDTAKSVMPGNIGLLCHLLAIPDSNPIRPIIEAIKMVQGPGAINRSETSTIMAPVMKPATGPMARPFMIVKVSVSPTLMRIPYRGPGDSKAMFPRTILLAAPTAMKVDANATSLDFGKTGWIIQP
jgi:hypothetical protein